MLRAARIVLLVVTACGPVVTVNGMQLARDAWNDDVATLQRRAPVDMGCPAERLAIEPLRDVDGQASQVEVKGCWKTALYVRTNAHSELTLHSVR